MKMKGVKRGRVGKRKPKSKPYRKPRFHNHPKKRKPAISEEVEEKAREVQPRGSDSEESTLSFDCEDYERTPRNRNNEEKVRNLLPLKNKDGLVFRTEVVPDVEDDMPTFDDAVEAKIPNLSETDQKSDSIVLSYSREQKNIWNLKCKVAMLSTAIITNPENNLKALNELVAMLKESTCAMIVSEKTVISLSLMNVFADILPGYRIRAPKETETKFKLKKETKALLNYEQSLLRYYKKYLDCLQEMVNDMRSKKQLGKTSATKKKAIKAIGIMAVKCLCNLLVSHLNFNYSKNIVQLLVSVISNRNEAVTNLCCEAFEKVFKADKLGELSLDVVRLAIKVIKERKFCVPGTLIRAFLYLNLREAKAEGGSKKADMRKVRKQLYTMSRKEKKYKKKMEKLQTELRETEAQENVENITKFHTETLKKVFWVYFHVLKDDSKISLISPVLEGLSKFAHLINLEFFDDLNSVLCGLLESGRLSDIEKLHCIHTLFTVLSGQAESLHIDPHKVYCHMYQILLQICISNNDQHYDPAIKCLNLMLMKRMKRLSLPRIVAFIKRLSTVSLQTPLQGTLALLNFARSLLFHTKGSDILLDTESTVGSGLYVPELDDPDYSNAQSSALWELHLLKQFYHPLVQMYSNHVLHGCPVQGRLSLPDNLVKLSSEQILEMLDNDQKIEGFDDVETPPKKKFKSNITSVTYSYEEDLELSWENVNDVNFAENVNC